MNKLSTTKPRIVKPTQTHIDWFDGFKPEQEKHLKKLTVKENAILKKLKKAFEQKKYEYNSVKHYKKAIRLLKDINCSAQDITNLSLALVEYQELEHFDKNAGHFLNLLIRASEERKFVIFTSHLDRNLRHMGFLDEEKEIIVKGDVNCAGESMSRGRIIVEGDDYGQAGYRMEGGELIVKGDVKKGDVGEGMTGGSIIVRGNANNGAGIEMRSGTIQIDGELFGEIAVFMSGGTLKVGGYRGSKYHHSAITHLYNCLGSVTGGNVFVGGKQLVKDGKVIAKDVLPKVRGP